MSDRREADIRRLGDQTAAIAHGDFTPVAVSERDDEIRVFDPRPFWELRTRYRKASTKQELHEALGDGLAVRVVDEA